MILFTRLFERSWQLRRKRERLETVRRRIPKVCPHGRGVLPCPSLVERGLENGETGKVIERKNNEHVRVHPASRHKGKGDSVSDFCLDQHTLDLCDSFVK